MNHEKILQMMRERKMSNKKLSEQSNVPLGTLNKILYGITKEPSVNAVQDIAKALGCTLDDFMDDSQANHSFPPSDYYLDDESAQKAQEIYEDPNTRILLDAKRDLTKEDLASVLNIVRSLKAKEEK